MQDELQHLNISVLSKLNHAFSWLHHFTNAVVDTSHTNQSQLICVSTRMDNIAGDGASFCGFH